jgi:soluble lytic murein transglycosylase-like protein
MTLSSMMHAIGAGSLSAGSGHAEVQARVRHLQRMIHQVNNPAHQPNNGLAPVPTTQTMPSSEPSALGKTSFASSLQQAATTSGSDGIPVPASLSDSLRTQKGQAAFARVINQISTKHGVDANLVNALVKQESAFNPEAVSSAGAQGLMQLMPATAKGLGVTDPMDPVQNLDGGIRYLKAKLAEHNGNIPLALASYNAGSGAVKKYGGIPPYAETQQYVKRILSNYLAANNS